MREDKPMKVFFDSNVIIDALTNREGSVEASKRLVYAAAVGQIEGVMASKQMTDIYYVLRKYVADDRIRRDLIETLLQSFEILSIDKDLLVRSLASEVPDYEDAVIAESARRVGASFIVTSDEKGFAGCGVSVKTPAEAASSLGI